MCSNISALAVLAMFPIAFSFWNNALRWSEDIYAVRVKCVSTGVLLLFLALHAVLPRFEYVQTRVSFVALEAVAVVGVLWTLLQAIMIQPAVMRTLFGQQEEALEAPAYTVVIVALSLDAVLTCSHLALPVRWFIMVWVDLLVVALFTAFAYVAHSAFSMELAMESFFVIVVFACLATGASLGSRTVESRDRALFATIADERTLRAQAEFNAAHSQARAARSHETSSHHSPASNSTRLFRSAAEHKEGSICQLVDLGMQEQWLIARHELSISQDDVLGRGGFGTVVAGEFYSSPVAIKHYNVRGNATVFDELRVMRRLRHPNIVLFYGACIDADSSELKLVLELVRGTILSRFIVHVEAQRVESPNREQQLSVMLGVCQALIYLHSRKPCIVHSDLKPGNIMVERRNSEPLPKLLDFGLSRRVNQRSRPGLGTLRYMAPEVILREEERPSAATDVYSLGLVCFATASGRKPFTALAPRQIERLFRHGSEAPSLDWQPGTALLQVLQPLIDQCTEFEPATRPTVQQVYDGLRATPTAIEQMIRLLEERAAISAGSSSASETEVSSVEGEPAQRGRGSGNPCRASL